ncbi:unnamed protein product, partial [Mesorhabditis spiculigera]
MNLLQSYFPYLALLTVAWATVCKTNFDASGEILGELSDVECNNNCEFCATLRHSGRFMKFQVHGCGCGDKSIFGPDEKTARTLNDCTAIGAQNGTQNGQRIRWACCAEELCKFS